MYRPIFSDDPRPPYSPQAKPPKAKTLEPPAVNWIFTLGLSLVFLVNGLIGFVSPGGYISLMQASPLTAWIPDYAQIIQLIALNDLCIGLLLLAYPRSRFLQTWAGAWLLGVALIKTTGLMG
ncbi:MAG: hypothetical protein SFU83_07910 [Meiothermus sp.]|nr:hypothetical protein [Meiothermus sp.]